LLLLRAGCGIGVGGCGVGVYACCGGGAGRGLSAGSACLTTVGLDDSWIGIFFPTIVAAMFHSSPFSDVSLIPTTAPHFEQKAWSALTEALHF